MPTQQPAQPVNIPVSQTQNQSQTQGANFNNGFNPTSTNNSKSESENNSIQSGVLSNTQINTAANLGTYRYSGGTQIPASSQLIFSANQSWNGSNDITTVTASYVYNFGGNAKKLAEREVAQYELGSVATLCTGLINQNIEIDYSILPEYEKCKAFKAIKPMTAEVEPSNELANLKAELQECIRINKELQRTNEAAQLRIIQLQNQPKARTSG